MMIAQPKSHTLTTTFSLFQRFNPISNLFSWIIVRKGTVRACIVVAFAGAVEFTPETFHLSQHSQTHNHIHYLKDKKMFYTINTKQRCGK